MSLEKVFTYSSYLIKIMLVSVIIFDIINAKYSQLFITSLTLVLLLIPSLFRRKYDVVIPLEIEILIAIFIFGTLFLGEIHNYYEIYEYWDVYLHTLSGILLGLLGFVIVYSIIETNTSNSLTPFFVSLFTFSFAVMIGVIWEIFEFFMDMFFGLNMQKSGLVDTMTDLIVDSLGALLVAVTSYFYMKKVNKFGVIYTMIDKIVNKKR
jgi:hypothetical protein